MFERLVLGVSGAIFLAYGVYCWIDPEKPAEFAGLFIATHNGYAEIVAMYGGLQSGFGVVLLACAFLRQYMKPGLWLLFICIGTLAAARGSVAFSDLDSSFQVASSSLDIGMSSQFTRYTWGALAFETLVTLLAGIGLIRMRKR